jgi:hypothetical protein
MNDLSELQAVDFAMGAHIAGAFTDLEVSGPKAYQEFLSRAVNKKIYRAESDTPRELLKRLAGAKEGETIDASGIKLNKALLPVVAYYRKPGLSNGMNNMTRSHDRVWDDAFTRAFKLHVAPVTLSYTMLIAAWDKLTLDKLQVAWWFYVLKNHRFDVAYNIAEEPMGTKAVVGDFQTLVFTDVSMPVGEGRLWAVESGVEVSTEVVSGELVEVPDVDVVSQFEGYCFDISCCEPEPVEV